MERFYVVTRADMPPGDQATQAVHAASAFAVAHPALHRAWHLTGKNLILLAIPDEAALRALYDSVDVPRAHFTEPDLGGEMTAIALAGDARKHVSSLPLALRGHPVAVRSAVELSGREVSSSVKSA